jgi:hypothetical protein
MCAAQQPGGLILAYAASDLAGSQPSAQRPGSLILAYPVSDPAGSRPWSSSILPRPGESGGAGIAPP